MKVIHEGLWCRIENASYEEIKSIADCLTFVDEEENLVPDIDLEEELKLDWGSRLDYFVFLQNDGDDFKFLSGLLPYFKEHYKGDFQIIGDQGITFYERAEIPRDYLDGIELWDHQQFAAEKAFLFRQGILDIPTRGGKTEVMLAITKYYLQQINPQGKLIFIEPDSNLMNQTYKRCKQRGLEDVGRLGDGHRELDCSVVVCIVDSLYNIVKNPDHPDYSVIQDVTAILIDEVHHLGSPSMAQAPLVMPNLELFIGVSGSPFNDKADPHANPRDIAIIGLLHRVILKVTPRYLMNEGIIAEPHVFILGYEGGPFPKYFIKSYRKVYSKFLLWNSGRNAMIMQVAELFQEYNFNLLILVTRISHGKFLLKRAHSFSPDTLFAFGGGNVIRHYSGEVPDDLPEDWSWYADKDDQKKGKRYIGLEGDQETLIQNHFEREGSSILIGSQVFDEGTDLPQVDALILTGGQGRSDVKNIQRPARALTRNQYDNRVFICDFWDDRHKYLKKHSELRIQTYKDHQYYIHTGGLPELKEHLTESKKIRDKVDGRK